MDSLENLIEGLGPFRCAVRVKIDLCDPPWVPWLSNPSPGYVEAPGIGPIQVAQVEWIEIAKSEVVLTGRLIADRSLDRSDELRQALAGAGVDFSESSDRFRIVVRQAD